MCVGPFNLDTSFYKHVRSYVPVIPSLKSVTPDVTCRRVYHQVAWLPREYCTLIARSKLKISFTTFIDR